VSLTHPTPVIGRPAHDVGDPHAARIDTVLALVEAGYAERMTLSQTPGFPHPRPGRSLMAGTADGAGSDRTGTVAIIGGVGGIATAVHLIRAGIDLTIFERSPGPGGVWWDNTYPGVAIDTPSHMYSSLFQQYASGRRPRCPPATSWSGTSRLRRWPRSSATATVEREVHAGRMPERPFVLVGQQYLADPSRSAGDIHPLWTYAHVPRGWSGDATEAITAQIERFAPGFRDRVVAGAGTSPAQFAADNPNFVDGNLLTGANDLRQVVLGPRIMLQPYDTPDHAPPPRPRAESRSHHRHGRRRLCTGPRPGTAW
jgi:hypothetical protein